MSWLQVIPLVFTALVSVGAMFVALRAMENAEASIRETKIRSGVNQLAADFAILSDDVSAMQNSMRKIRNRENARHAREVKADKANGSADNLSDAEFLKAVELGRFNQ